MANLVIMESPSKANTVKGYLGSNYKVIASVGHVRDLPKSTLGVDIENDFAAHYINIRGKGDIINLLTAVAQLADARQNKITAFYSLLLSKANLYKSIGKY